MVTLANLRAALDTHNEPYGMMPLQGGIILVITQRGGRIFAFNQAGKPLIWINPALGSPQSFGDFVARGEWNMGGERIWIAPEIQYIIQDRRDFWGTHRLPRAIDPGQYTLKQASDAWTLSQQIELEAYNTASGTKRLHIDRRIEQIANPLRDLPAHDALMDGVQFSGYQQLVTLTETNNTPMLSESWNLVQLYAGGSLVIPVTSAAPTVSRYFGTPADDALNASNGVVRIAITGTQQYKTGYKAAALTGRMAYLLDDTLLIRSFDSNPSATYAEEPPDAVGVRGHSVHVYNDGGDLGGFGEMECSGQAIGAGTDLDTGRTTSTDAFRMWIFTGQAKRLKAIGAQLLGVPVL